MKQKILSILAICLPVLALAHFVAIPQTVFATEPIHIIPNLSDETLNFIFLAAIIMTLIAMFILDPLAYFIGLGLVLISYIAGLVIILSVDQLHIKAFYSIIQPRPAQWLANFYYGLFLNFGSYLYYLALGLVLIWLANVFINPVIAIPLSFGINFLVHVKMMKNIKKSYKLMHLMYQQQIKGKLLAIINLLTFLAITINSFLLTGLICYYFLNR